MDLSRYSINSGDNVLLLWQLLPEESEAFDNFLENLDQIINPKNGIVFSSNIYDFHPNDVDPLRFDVIISGFIPPHNFDHNFKKLSQIGEIIKPHARLYIYQDKEHKVESALKLCGISEKSKEVLSNDVTLYSCQFPDFEMGSSTITSPGPKPTSSSAWNLPDDDLNDIETMESEDLLSPEDFKKPQASELRVCGTTGKKKACKDCSCGLREELDAGQDPTKKDVNSSCGSCYLGDAFRCGSCPYLGMPAFKPGEKVSLSDMELKADN
eukprot:TRINITY_DN1118_c0_g1_i1.p1 TRINITY_DN1118_c0_g1~~TRINITY_DN1118_c0_g1_i1.p1  ORF type:complete len:268 (+),score=65.36 TRINITY_DN1118_c0_g1_i1:80-883(+)